MKFESAVAKAVRERVVVWRPWNHKAFLGPPLGLDVVCGHSICQVF